MKELKTLSTNFCLQPWSHLFLHNSGRIQPCCMNSTSLGSVFDHNINSIWNGKEITKTRKYILKGDYTKAGCKRDCYIRYQMESTQDKYALPEEWITSARFSNSYQKNIELLIESLQLRTLHTANLPLFVDIQPSEMCNMACIMCHQNHRKKNHIPSHIIENFLDWPEKLYATRFQGGELFLDHRVPDFLSRLKDKQSHFQQIHVITNGSLTPLPLLKTLTEPPNPIRFTVSLDAVEAGLFKKIRNSSYFQRVHETIINLANIQRDQNRNDIVIWNFVVMKSNIHQIEEAFQQSSALGVSISFQPVIGPYEKENFFDYPAIRPPGVEQSLRDCLKMTTKGTRTYSSLRNCIRKLEENNG